MPQRFLRPGITNSERYNALSWPAQSLFVRILTLVDDFGRYDGRPNVILGQCYSVWNHLHPKKTDAVTLQQVEQMLQELAAKHLILIYDAAESGKRVLQVLQWQERIRAGVKEKWPAPPATAAIGSNLQQPAGSRSNLQPSSPPPVPSPSPSPSPRARADAAADFPETLFHTDAAKRAICEKILVGEDPAQLWSPDAENRLAQLCELGLPLQQIVDIGDYRAIPKSDDLPELQKRVEPITSSTLMRYWSDEARRARSFLATYRRTAAKKKEPENWRDFFTWKYGERVVLPLRFDLLSQTQREEWKREGEDFVGVILPKLRGDAVATA